MFLEKLVQNLTEKYNEGYSRNDIDKKLYRNGGTAVRLNGGKYYLPLDWNIRRLEVLIKPLPGDSSLDNLKFYFNNISKRIKMNYLKLINKIINSGKKHYGSNGMFRGWY